MEDIKTVYVVIAIAVIVIQFLAQWFWIKFEIKQVRKDSELNDKIIEDKRLTNVKALREIYDAKVDDAKKYSKGLFEIRESELSDLSKRMSALENKFDAQTENLNSKFEQLIKSNAFIEAHIKTCPYYGKSKVHA